MKSLLLFCAHDRADAVVLEPGGEDCRLYTIVGDGKYEMVPPPWDLYPQIVAVARAMFTGSSELHGPARGSLEVVTDRGQATATAEIEPSDAGDVLRIRFVYHEPAEDAGKSKVSC